MNFIDLIRFAITSHYCEIISFIQNLAVTNNMLVTLEKNFTTNCSKTSSLRGLGLEMSFNVPLCFLTPHGRFYLFSCIQDHSDERWISEIFPILKKVFKLKLIKKHLAGNTFQISKWKKWIFPDLLL